MCTKGCWLGWGFQPETHEMNDFFLRLKLRHLPWPERSCFGFLIGSCSLGGELGVAPGRGECRRSFIGCDSGRGDGWAGGSGCPCSLETLLEE